MYDTPPLKVLNNKGEKRRAFILYSTCSNRSHTQAVLTTLDLYFPWPKPSIQSDNPGVDKTCYSSKGSTFTNFHHCPNQTSFRRAGKKGGLLQTLVTTPCSGEIPAAGGKALSSLGCLWCSSQHCKYQQGWCSSSSCPFCQPALLTATGNACWLPQLPAPKASQHSSHRH